MPSSLSVVAFACAFSVSAAAQPQVEAVPASVPSLLPVIVSPLTMFAPPLANSPSISFLAPPVVSPLARLPVASEFVSADVLTAVPAARAAVDGPPTPRVIPQVSAPSARTALAAPAADASALGSLRSAAGAEAAADGRFDGGRGFSVAEAKYDYFFGKVTGDPHNLNRSKQIARVLADNGIDDSPEGRRKLLALFDRAFAGADFNTKDGDHGRAVVKTIQLPAAQLQVTFFYAPGDQTPKVTTIVSKEHPRERADSTAKPPAATPFAAIVPKVSRAQLGAKLAMAAVGATESVLLGQGTEADAGVHAVAEKTANGTRFYANKLYDTQRSADGGVAALRLAKRLQNKKLLIGLEAVDVLSASPNSTTVKLALTEGLDMSQIIRERESNPAYAPIVEKYKEALRATAAALDQAGWTTKISSDSKDLFVYASPEAAAAMKVSFQFITSNVVATPDGRFVLIDPF